MKVERYADMQQRLWDTFVERSKNGTFLFNRHYMDYHRDRFSDHSLLIYEDDRLIALLPANQTGTTLVSHGGLTYGGFISDASMKTPLMLRVFEAALEFCREAGFTGVRYKAMPHIYPRVPAQEDLYALHLCGAQLAERSVMTAFDMRERVPPSPARKNGANRGRKLGLRAYHADEDTYLAAYWQLLEETLRERHEAQPVHSFAEIERLQYLFPRQIRLYACFEGETLLAGVLIFESTCVARVQYTAASPRGRELRALDLLFDHLLNEVFITKPYFDFGTSHDPATHALNGGLIDQKESFGGRAVAQDTYWIDLEHWTPQALREAIV